MSYVTGHSRHSLTVVILTYQHEDVIEKAIASVLDQSIAEEIEIVVSDDASTDRSVEIAKFATRDRSNVVVKSNTKNLGIMKHYEKIISEVTTEFVAILEGDDYWIDNRALLDKLNFFRCVPSLECVFSAYRVLYEETKLETYQPSLFSRKRNGFVFFEDLLEENHIASFSNCMYRTNSLRELLHDPVTHLGYDWLLNLRMADRGPIGFWKNICTTYVVHGKGTWSSMSRDEQIEAEITTLETLRECTDSMRRSVINEKINRLRKVVNGE